MRVLHVGWGFSPWRDGGLIAYAENLMGAQVERGHEVSYFLSGRHYPYVSGPRVKRWRRRGVSMHEVINPTIVPGLEHGTRDPLRDLSEPAMEAAFRRAVEEARPEAIHIQELSGIPSSVIDISSSLGVPTAMTLHDYGPLCTTLRLFDSDGQVCMRREIGADCVLRNSDAPAGPGPWVEQTIRFEVARARRLLGREPREVSLQGRLRRPLVMHGVLDKDLPQVERLQKRPGGASARAAEFQRRREVNVERLGRVGRLIAQSPRLAELYRALGVSGERMSVMPAPARHIERLRPRRFDSAPSTLTFATLNGCASASKGSEVIVAALGALREAGLEGRFRLRVHGHVHPAVHDALGSYRGVEMGGLYRADQLDELLEDVDVGLMPSMWEEAYGYTGLEMIAKGIPLIAHPIGGIVQYAREGSTAWLNESRTGEGLAALVSKLIAEPRLVVDMHQRVVAARDELIPRWEAHVDDVDAVYRELASGRG